MDSAPEPTGYQAETDPRIKLLSYSSLLTLHKCPRKFELYKLGSEISVGPSDSQSLTFAFGHMVGSGVQGTLRGDTLEQIIWTEFLAWPCDLFEENPKQNKSFWSALRAIQQFHYIFSSGSFDGYELAYYKGEPAIELSFAIILPGDYVYRGYVDAVLQHKTTGKVMCLEIKTTASNVRNPAQYKNSSQAIGYSIVLDAMFPTLSSYDVRYMPYYTKAEEYERFDFPKSYFSRALWINELLLEVQRIEMYEQSRVYPMHGESCLDFGRECEYYGICTLSTERLTKKLSQADQDKILDDLSKFQIIITIEELVQAQLAKNISRPTINTGASIVEEVL